MNSQYGGSLVDDDYNENSMESHAEDDNSITTEERDKNSSEAEQSSITTENNSEEELDPWTTLINDAASKARDQYDDILQVLLMENHDESAAKQEAFAQILPVSQKELGSVYMDKAIAAAVKKRKFLLKQLLEDQGRFPEQLIQIKHSTKSKINYCPNCL